LNSVRYVTLEAMYITFYITINNNKKTYISSNHMIAITQLHAVSDNYHPLLCQILQ